jgi:hypothetical protein
MKPLMRDNLACSRHADQPSPSYAPNMTTCMGRGDRIGVLARIVTVGLGTCSAAPTGRKETLRPNGPGTRCRVPNRRSHDQFGERDARHSAVFRPLVRASLLPGDFRWWAKRWPATRAGALLH